MLKGTSVSDRALQSVTVGGPLQEQAEGQAIGRHTSFATALPPSQTEPFSTVHAGLQPSPDAVLPSSQSSNPIRLPSPHTVAQNLATALATVNVLPGYAALHVLWLAAGLAGVELEA